MKILFTLLPVIISIIFISCEKKTEIPLIIPPDYLKITAEPLNAIQGAKIKMITSYVPKYPFDTDTVYLNNLGKISMQKGYGGWAQYAYDTLGNLVHEYKSRGGSANYFFSYRRKKNNLIQIRYFIPHMKWEFDKKKDTLHEYDSLTYIFHNDGRLNQRIYSYFAWEESKHIINYTYSPNKKLSSVESYRIDVNSDTTIKGRSVFKYNQIDSTVFKIEHYRYLVDDTILFEYFYNGDGLLDSMRRGDLVRIYNYEYY